MRTQPLYAVISGFEPDDVPGVGTFYDFVNRLWKLDTYNISSHIKFPKRKPSNPPKKGDKAAPIEKNTVAEELDAIISGQSLISSHQPFSLLFKINAKSGAMVYLSRKDNPRLFTTPARDSSEWHSEYNKSSSVERANKFMKVDCLLEHGRHCSSKMWYFRLYCIMMYQKAKM